MRTIIKKSAVAAAVVAMTGTSFAFASVGTAEAAGTCSTVAQCAAGSQPTLKIGKRSSDVARLQRALTKAGFNVPATGYFGSMTRTAVKRYQRANGLPVTGVAASMTWGSLQGDSGRGKAPKARRAAAPASAPVSSGAGSNAITSFALAQVGKPYGYGATGPSAYDCSGLTSASLRAAGISIPRTSQAQARGGRTVSLSEAQPGDIVVYYSGASHVGIYLGNGKIVHASRPGRPVSVVPVNSMPINKVVRYA